MATLGKPEVTEEPDINALLAFLARDIQELFGTDLVGFYLTGSLTYDAFDPKRSDIDLAVVLTRPVAASELGPLEALHRAAEEKFARWRGRIECSYVPQPWLSSILPPTTPRPYMGGGKFYPAATYGNEWIINNYLLYRYGVPLVGPEFPTLTAPIALRDVQAANQRDLYREWVPLIKDPSPLGDSHLQSYVVLNLCRILYAAREGCVGSKRRAVAWAQDAYPRWKNLILAADAWRYGEEMRHIEDTVSFIKFVAAEIGPLTNQ